MIGSHVERSHGAHRRRSNGEPASARRVEFSNSRRSQRATRGYVDQVSPQAQSGESDADFARRSNRRGYVEQIQARSRTRRIATGAVVAIAVAAIALIAGVGAFFAFSDSRLSLGDSNVEEALVASEAGEPYYVLCAARLGTATQPEALEGQAYMVVRIDEANRVLTFLSVPPEIEVTTADGATLPLGKASESGGEAEVVRQISSLLGVNISHYARTDAEGLSRLVDLVGGVPVALDEEVDDPDAGVRVIAAGETTLDGQAALVLLRADNYRDALSTQARMRALFSVNLAARASSGEGLSFASVVSDATADVATDWSSGQIMALGDALRPLAEATVYAAVVPGTLATNEDGSQTYRVDDDALSAMMEAVSSGESPDSAEGSVATVDRSQVTVEVRNGANVTGAAARMGELLESDGYQVVSVGNTNDNTIYPETLVIYKKPEAEIEARAVVADLAAGRVVNGGDFYSFDADVLVVLGQDWVPGS